MIMFGCQLLIIYMEHVSRTHAVIDKMCTNNQHTEPQLLHHCGQIADGATLSAPRPPTDVNYTGPSVAVACKPVVALCGHLEVWVLVMRLPRIR
ncbi:hypothetical protein F4780DRAFT_20582 [Xylariomycetidae sp. FL0641]|nr:hypothetical protein F4780DRAFT_20582 [Xylariomycetidae sp. FL0641]